MATDVNKKSFTHVPPYALHYNYKVYKYDDGSAPPGENLPQISARDSIVPGTEPTTVQPAAGNVTPTLLQTQPPVQFVSTAPTYDPVRLNFLEDRLSAQEKNTTTLIDHAFRLRDNISSSLTQSNWYDESQTRQLLQDHIHTITSVCKRLSRDIEALEKQLNTRDMALATTTSGVKTLEQHHVNVVLELKGRVARCDAAISKLAGVMKQQEQWINQLQGQINKAGQDLTERLSRLEVKVMEAERDLQETKTTLAAQIRGVHSDTELLIKEYNQKYGSNVEELRSLLEEHRREEDEARAAMEERLRQTIEDVRLMIDTRINDQEEKLALFMEGTNRRMSNLDDAIQNLTKMLHMLESNFDERVSALIEPLLAQAKARLDKLKKETKDGFSSVQDSINNMRAVQDGKRKQVEESLRTEITNLRKAVVLT